MNEQTSNPTSGQNVPKSKFRRKSRQEQTTASKLRMERRGEKLDAAREKLAKQKPPKKPGAVKRLAHTTGHGVHGFVHGKLYGLNALSNNLIMVDRKKLKNPNGLILGTPGSGKSFSAKREICNAFLVTDDDIIIADPEAEYAPLVERLHGQVIHISPASTQYINPMDINSNYSEEDNPLALKADFVLSLCELVVGGKEGLQPVEKTVIDRCVHLIYRKYFANPCPENMPILEDLYNALLQQDEKEAHHVATALEIYVKGSLNLFNHRTNVNVNNRIVCYDIKELGKQKLSEGKSEGYARWAKRYNLKEMSKTLIFLQENKIGSIEEMQERVNAATAHYHELGDSIKAAEQRMAEIAVLRTHIVNYARTRPVYDAYRKTGYSKHFLETHRTEITLHKAAKAAFNESNLKTLPKVKELDVEYSKLLTEKKARYPDYRKAKEEIQELLRAKRNVELFFAEEKSSAEKTKSR